MRTSATRKSRLVRVFVAAAGLAGLLGVGGYLYLFRSTAAEIGLGVYELRWEWGSLQEVRADLNRDGADDLIGRYEGWAYDRAAEEPFATAIASSRCDGNFDVTINYEGGVYSSLEFDSDGDGIREVHEPEEGFEWMAQRCKVWARIIQGSSHWLHAFQALVRPRRRESSSLHLRIWRHVQGADQVRRDLVPEASLPACREEIEAKASNPSGQGVRSSEPRLQPTKNAAVGQVESGPRSIRRQIVFLG